MSRRCIGSSWLLGHRPSPVRGGSVRHGLSLAAVVLLGLATFTGELHAAPLAWQGTLQLRVHRTAYGGIPAPARPEPLAFVALTGSGIATPTNVGSGAHLGGLMFDGGITGVASGPVTDPDVTQGSGIIRVIASGELGSGTLDTSGPGVVPVRGLLKVCLYDANCAPGAFFMTPLVGHGALSSEVGFGIGGTFTTRPALSHPRPGAGIFRISIIGAPWTVGAVTLDSTGDGGMMTVTGFAHGPASLTSSTVAAGGMLQMVTATRVSSDGPGGSNLVQYFGILTVRVVPEPGALVLLGSGVGALLLMGLRRGR